jgi:RNA-binding protein PNO1
MDVDSDTDDLLINPSSAAALHTDPTLPPDAAAALVSSSSGFAPLSAKAQAVGGIKNEFRRIPVPDHRMTPMKREWVNIYTPLVEQLGLQVRMNAKRRAVEIRVSSS